MGRWVRAVTTKRFSSPPLRLHDRLRQIWVLSLIALRHNREIRIGPTETRTSVRSMRPPTPHQFQGICQTHNLYTYTTSPSIKPNRNNTGNKENIILKT